MTIGKVICCYTIEPLFDPVPLAPRERSPEPARKTREVESPLVAASGLPVVHAPQREG
jgi:hypothetical protein